MSEQSNELLEKGKLLFFDYKREQAVDEFKKALNLEPNNYEIIGWLAISLFLIHKMNDARDILKKVENINCAEIYLAKGLAIDLIEKKYEQAIIYYTKALDLKPNNVFGYVLRGLSYAHLNMAKESMSDFKKALHVGKSAYIHCSYGYARQLLNDPKGAKKTFNQVLKSNPDNLQAYIYRADLNESLGNTQEALTDYNKIISLDPRHKFALASRCMIRGMKGDFQDALREINMVLDIDPLFPFALGIRHLIYMEQGKNELAMIDQIKLFEIVGIPLLTFDDAQLQKIYNSIYEHINNIALPDLKTNDEKLVDFWICYFLWGEESTQSLHQGKQSQAYHGRYGLGYICLSDKYLRIFSVGKLSKKYANKIGAGVIKKAFGILFNNYDKRRAEKDDIKWVIPFNDIQGINNQDNGFILATFSEKWEVLPYWGNNSEILAALELARTGNLRKTIDMGKLRINPKAKNESDDPFEQIKKLAELRDLKAITEEMYEEKIKVLMAKIQ